MKKYRILFLLSLLFSLGFSWPWPLSVLFSSSNTETFGSNPWLQKEEQIFSSRTDINSHVLHLSLVAYIHAKKKGLVQNPYLTVVDFSKPSNEKRLWVLDLNNGREVFDTFVSHGKNSGGLVPTSFSNTSGSLKSSLGVYLTEDTYFGKDGYSLHLRGLERGINDNAYRRSVIIHGAWYVNPDTIRKYGQAGKSWGCLAVGSDLAKPIINTIKDRSVVFAYYPDRNWLSHSQYLT
ncbi:MAG: murein L,D-transpeptidase catalytic domain family protein [Gammaproteobacteria bacterium]|nr:murein L,D-transpeptidase catalytic domain family protein [Gammaproteobacteria bacterium]